MDNYPPLVQVVIIPGSLIRTGKVHVVLEEEGGLAINKKLYKDGGQSLYNLNMIYDRFFSIESHIPDKIRTIPHNIPNVIISILKLIYKGEINPPLIMTFERENT